MEPDCSRYNIAGPVFGGCGGATLYRREVFNRVGLFDEVFFAYLEDVDLNLRMLRAGLTGYYVPEALVYHVGSATSGSKINSFTVRLSTRNSFYILAKHYTFTLLFRWMVVIGIYQFCWFLFCLKKRQGNAWLHGVGQALLGVNGQRRKLKTISAGDRMTARDFAAHLTKAEEQVVLSIMHRRKTQGKGTALLRLYKFLFL